MFEIRAADGDGARRRHAAEDGAASRVPPPVPVGPRAHPRARGPVRARLRGEVPEHRRRGDLYAVGDAAADQRDGDDAELLGDLLQAHDARGHRLRAAGGSDPVGLLPRRVRGRTATARCARSTVAARGAVHEHAVGHAPSSGRASSSTRARATTSDRRCGTSTFPPFTGVPAPRTRRRFAWKRGGKRWFGDIEAVEVSFRGGRPADARRPGRTRRPARQGPLLDRSRRAARSPAARRVSRSSPRAPAPTSPRSTAPEPKLALWVPAEMREEYDDLPGARPAGLRHTERGDRALRKLPPLQRDDGRDGLGARRETALRVAPKTELDG